MTPADFDQHAPSRLPLPAGTLAGLLIAILAVGTVALFSYRSLQSRSEAANLITHTKDVIQQLESIGSTNNAAESAQRGYLLTSEPRYFEQYNRASALAPAQADRLTALVADNPEQLARAETMRGFITTRLQVAAETIELQRTGDSAAAMALLRSGRGIAAMDAIRDLIVEMSTAAQRLLQQREVTWQAAERLSLWVTFGGSATLIVLIAIAAVLMSRDYSARQAVVWMRTGQMSLTSRLQGEQRLEHLGGHVADFLAGYLGAQVGAVYAVEDAGSFRRIGGYALPAADTAIVRAGDGLAGQAAKSNHTLHVMTVPDGYLPISSTLGAQNPRELLISPASADGVVQAIIELGFFRHVLPVEREFMSRVSEILAVAVRSSRDRTKLEVLLAQTQQQAEELQTQQEELRVSNEELAEQSRVLNESQARLESQQAELEQINSHLEEQTQLLEAQKEDLSRAQTTLTDRAGELQRANQYKSEFLANMSHELRTPLNSALILATLLAENRDGNLTDEQVTFARTIHEAGNDLLALINDVLDLSKIEAGKVELSVEPVSIATTVDSLVKTFEPLAAQKQLAFEAVIAEDVPPRIESDSQRLGQVLKNLLSNAIKFTEQGRVTLRVSTAGPGLIDFVVEDTGIGIPPHQQDVIFEAFRQADGSTHRKYGGTGLGLSIARDLAHLLGGDLTVRSESGRGSVFTLSVPAVFQARPRLERPAPLPPSPPPPRSTPAAPSAAATAVLARPAIEDDRDQLAPGSRRILVVEDDTRFAAILRDLAREKGFQCLVAHTAHDGLATAAAFAPNAILLDVNLPDHSGLTVLDQLKHDPRTRHVPVHVISVADHAHHALERGAIGYAFKPVDRDQLSEAFQRLESKMTQGVRRVLVVEDDPRQGDSIRQLLAADDVAITVAATAAEALAHLKQTTFDCVVMDLKLPDLSGGELLEQMAAQEDVSFPPVIVYTGRSLTADEEQQLRRFSKSIIIKDARSPERLLDEVTLFLHQVEATMPIERQRMLKAARNREAAFENRRILVVDDDARNIFALSRVLEPRGAKVDIARNGREALNALARRQAGRDGRIDLVLMDIMMPEMDGLTAMTEIRKNPAWKTLPIIALTAKAMRDDQEKCRAAGANDYIAKPFDVEKLLSLIRVWMPK